MPPSHSPLAHQDIRAVMDRALENGRGCRVAIASIGEGYSLRQRFYTLRKSDRERAEKLFPNDDPRWGRSVYDALTIYVAGPNEDDPDDSLFCVIEVASEDRLMERVEDL